MAGEECLATMALGCNITGYDFVIRYRQGVDNDNADALYRSSYNFEILARNENHNHCARSPNYPVYLLWK